MVTTSRKVIQFTSNNATSPKLFLEAAWGFDGHPSPSLCERRGSHQLHWCKGYRGGLESVLSLVTKPNQLSGSNCKHHLTRCFRESCPAIRWWSLEDGTREMLPSLLFLGRSQYQQITALKTRIERCNVKIPKQISVYGVSYRHTKWEGWTLQQHRNLKTIKLRALPKQLHPVDSIQSQEQHTERKRRPLEEYA